MALDLASSRPRPSSPSTVVGSPFPGKEGTLAHELCSQLLAAEMFHRINAQQLASLSSLLLSMAAASSSSTSSASSASPSQLQLLPKSQDDEESELEVVDDKDELDDSNFGQKRKRTDKSCARLIANKRERDRVHSIGEALLKLKLLLPCPATAKLSKVATLRLATHYIAFLDATLKDENADVHRERFFNTFISEAVAPRRRRSK